jgi:hypothetical protein
MIVEPPIAFLPSVHSLTPNLFAIIFTNEGVRIQMTRMVAIFGSEEPCSS